MENQKVDIKAIIKVLWIFFIIIWIFLVWFFIYTKDEISFKVKCDLKENDVATLNQFFEKTSYNWDSKYWCNVEEILSEKIVPTVLEEKQIPNEIWKLKNLRILNLKEKWLIWNIPKELWNLEKLRFLWLSWNKLSWEIPKEIWRLKNLHSLILSKNELTWLISQEIWNLKKLEILQLSENKFSWEFPKEIENLKKLKILEQYQKT